MGIRTRFIKEKRKNKIKTTRVIARRFDCLGTDSVKIYDSEGASIIILTAERFKAIFGRLPKAGRVQAICYKVVTDIVGIEQC